MRTAVEGTDYHAVKSGYVSVTPLRSDMTDHQALTAIETWNYLKTPSYSKRAKRQHCRCAAS